ncbi:MAG: CcmD family protein [Gaiellaceae bacterium]
MSRSDDVVAAYAIVFVTLLVYVAIIAAKLARLERETAELARAKRDSHG